MRWKYDQETRDRVVRLYHERRDAYPDESIRGTLRYLNELVGVSPETIRSWVRKAQQEQEVRVSGVSVTEREEILALRREVAELKRANEILKTASAFFAAAELDRKLK